MPDAQDEKKRGLDALFDEAEALAEEHIDAVLDSSGILGEDHQHYEKLWLAIEENKVPLERILRACDESLEANGNEEAAIDAIFVMFQYSIPESDMAFDLLEHLLQKPEVRDWLFTQNKEDGQHYASKLLGLLLDTYKQDGEEMAHLLLEWAPEAIDSDAIAEIICAGKLDDRNSFCISSELLEAFANHPGVREALAERPEAISGAFVLKYIFRGNLEELSSLLKLFPDLTVPQEAMRVIQEKPDAMAYLDTLLDYGAVDVPALNSAMVELLEEHDRKLGDLRQMQARVDTEKTPGSLIGEVSTVEKFQQKVNTSLTPCRLYNNVSN